MCSTVIPSCSTLVSKVLRGAGLRHCARKQERCSVRKPPAPPRYSVFTPYQVLRVHPSSYSHQQHVLKSYATCCCSALRPTSWPSTCALPTNPWSSPTARKQLLSVRCRARAMCLLCSAARPTPLFYTRPLPPCGCAIPAHASPSPAAARSSRWAPLLVKLLLSALSRSAFWCSRSAGPCTLAHLILLSVRFFLKDIQIERYSDSLTAHASTPPCVYLGNHRSGPAVLLRTPVGHESLTCPDTSIQMLTKPYCHPPGPRDRDCTVARICGHCGPHVCAHRP